MINPQLLDIHSDQNFKEAPIVVLDKKIQILRNNEILLVKVQWQNHVVEESNWKCEVDIKLNIHYSSITKINFEYNFFFKEVRM